MEHGEGQRPGRRREPTGELIGPYAIVAEIARGEATTVYLAQKYGALGFHRLAAIKRLKPAFAKSAEWTQLLLDEARLSSGVHHANIVDVIDVGTEGGCYLVMDYVEGADLDALLTRAGKERHPRYVLPPIADALHGLQAVHTALDEVGSPLAMVHQAPKARHILVGIDGTARLTDFSQVWSRGLAPSHLRYGRLKSPYMAPEQLRGSQPVDARADLFIVGITLWEALTGERLFQADTMELSRRAVLERHIPRPSDVGLRPPRALDAICLRALARDPDQRYASAAEMARDVRDVGLNEALFATAGELGQWVRALAGGALIERRRALGADAPSLEIALEALEDGPSKLGARPNVEIAAAQTGVSAAPSAPSGGERSPLPGEPSRVTRMYTVAVAAPPNGSRVSARPSASPTATLLGTAAQLPLLSRPSDAPAGEGSEHRSVPPGPGAYRQVAADRRGITTLPESAPRREGGTDAKIQRPEPQGDAGSTRPAEPPSSSAGAAARPPTVVAAGSHDDGSRVLRSPGGSAPFERTGQAQAAPRARQVAPSTHAPVLRGSERDDGSLRPSTRAAHIDLPGSDEPSESARGLGVIALISAAIIVLAAVVGIRQWRAEHDAPRTGAAAAGQDDERAGESPSTPDPAIGIPGDEPNLDPATAAGDEDHAAAPSGSATDEQMGQGEPDRDAGAVEEGTEASPAPRERPNRAERDVAAERKAAPRPRAQPPARRPQPAPAEASPPSPRPASQDLGLPDNPY